MIEAYLLAFIEKYTKHQAFTIIFVNNLQYLLQKANEEEKTSKINRKKISLRNSFGIWGHSPSMKVNKSEFWKRSGDGELSRHSTFPIRHGKSPFPRATLPDLKASLKDVFIDRKAECSFRLFRVHYTISLYDTLSPTRFVPLYWCVDEKQKCLWCGNCA